MTLHFGMVRVSAATPQVSLANPNLNVERTVDLLTLAAQNESSAVAFPELGLTGYTCHDLFHQSTLLNAAHAALLALAARSAKVFPGLAVVGLPLAVDDAIYNCAAVVHQGKVLGIVPKSYLANHGEFYDARYFAPAAQTRITSVTLANGESVPFGTDLLFAATNESGLIVGIEICEDLWSPVPPSSRQALAGATVLLNLSASNELVGKAAYRKQLVIGQSGRCVAGYVYCSSGVHESTQDIVFGGHCLIAENGALLAESDRFRRDHCLITADIDVERLRTDRWGMMSFGQSKADQQESRPFRRIAFDAPLKQPSRLFRTVEAHPFVPSDNQERDERCREVFDIQTAGLARRLEHIGQPTVAIGVSGGLDSTLALMVACRAFDLMGQSRKRILGLAMLGFGTTHRTAANADALMRQLGVDSKRIDIRPLCLAEWQALGHAPFGIALAGLNVDSLSQRIRELPQAKQNDLVFENVQARVRTQLLMNSGFVIGTGDLSELALGWCTYNADHMSMYAVNVGVPKTLVKFLVRWAAQRDFAGAARSTLEDIANTVISPELLPVSDHGGAQSTETAIGPYELHDFFLFHLLRYGAPLDKIRFLARFAKFDQPYTASEIDHWLQVFVRRFFANQFKRSCLPDGPKVGSISLSPRGDWRMPPDANPTAWT